MIENQPQNVKVSGMKKNTVNQNLVTVYRILNEKTPIKVPPIKTQGIKTKLVRFIAESIRWDGNGKWIEPFFGSGVVLFNISPKKALATESNIHIVNLYKSIQSNEITAQIVRSFLEQEGKKLEKHGESYYYEVRDRFNECSDSLDFLFLNRACFNGLMRFNSKGRYNVPFCRKPERFSKSYITKITNQVAWLGSLLANKKSWRFEAMDWRESVKKAEKNDFLYLDPPTMEETQTIMMFGARLICMILQGFSNRQSVSLPFPCGLKTNTGKMMTLKNTFQNLR